MTIQNIEDQLRSLDKELLDIVEVVAKKNSQKKDSPAFIPEILIELKNNYGSSWVNSTLTYKISSLVNPTEKQIPLLKKENPRSGDRGAYRYSVVEGLTLEMIREVLDAKKRKEVNLESRRPEPESLDEKIRKIDEVTSLRNKIRKELDKLPFEEVVKEFKLMSPEFQERVLLSK